MTRRRLPPLRALRALEALHLTGSVSHAADRLAITHSAVSHQIRLLETWLGRALAHRVGRHTRLTEEGESLARVTAEAFDTIRHEIDRLPLRSRRPITVAALPIIATEWLLPRLPALTAALGGPASLHLSYAHSDRPLRPEPDMTILFARHDALAPEDVPLLPGDAVPVCTPAFLARFAGNAESALAAGPFLHDEDLRLWRDWFDASGCATALSADPPQLFVEGSSLLRAAALEGLGIALCRRALITRDVAEARLVVLSAVATDTDWSYVLRVSAARRGDRHVDAVAEWLAAVAGESR